MVTEILLVVLSIGIICGIYIPGVIFTLISAGFRAGWVDSQIIQGYKDVMKHSHILSSYFIQLATHPVVSYAYWLQNIAPCVHGPSVIDCIKIGTFRTEECRIT